MCGRQAAGYQAFTPPETVHLPRQQHVLALAQQGVLSTSHAVQLRRKLRHSNAEQAPATCCSLSMR